MKFTTTAIGDGCQDGIDKIMDKMAIILNG